MQKNILIIDSTLRDGSHAMSHQFTAQNISDYAKGAELAGTKILVVGHGNGLGASSLQLGQSLLSDKKMLTTAKKELTKTKLAVLLIPGYGTIKENIEPAISYGIDVLIVASHCTEANITKQHIQYGLNKGLEVYGVLMMSHMISADLLLKQALLMQEYGVKGVILMDSAGAYLPEDVTKKISSLVKGLKIEVGFHAHNNLGLAIANSLTAIKAGATILDVTSRGLGAGAGNCQLEVLAAILQKMDIKTNLDLYKLMDNSENIIAKLMKHPQVINNVTLTSGLAGVFSGFAPHVIKAANRFNVDARDILIELGKKKVVGGQEDIIIDVATFLKQKKDLKENNCNIESLQ
ncbi:MAG: 4-hydroxy-2-oxovalerate aldolase [Candidatus Shapirobacteria bacterium]|jgi:4-hydroxy 2-oxovalerate aldolase